MTQFGLTKRQQQAYEALVVFRLQNRRMPTTAELAVALGNSASSKAGTSSLLKQLEERGYIKRAGRKHGAIAFVDPTAPLGGDVLKPSVRASLNAFCRIRGETHAAVINDAVALFLDQEGGAYADEKGILVDRLVEVTVPGAPA